MKDIERKIIDDFVYDCRRAARCGLMRCSSGNLSLRIDSERLLITSSRSWMERMSPDDLSVCRISDGSLLEGKKPSAEIGFHAGIMNLRPDVNVVLHFQTPYATALACREVNGINYFLIPEIPFYIGPVAHIPYLTPGSQDLARAVVGAMRNHDMVVMGNHGQVTVAGDMDHAIQNAEFFELVCGIIIHSGDRPVPLPDEDVERLLELRRASKTAV